MHNTLSAVIFEWLTAIIQSVVATYVLLILIRIATIIRLCKFFGNYSHLPADKANFEVSYKWSNLLSLVPNLAIIITRKSLDIGFDSQDWSGVFYSDILNPFFYKGVYIIKDAGLHDSDGWHEIYFFEKSIIGTAKPKIRIAFNLHHLDVKNHKWIGDQGYYIEKK